jgi:DNA invertase Pin-like site-specific DNA recombinase
MTFVGAHSDGATQPIDGDFESRSGLSELSQRCEPGEIDVLICGSRDDLSRDAAELEAILSFMYKWVNKVCILDEVK